MTYKKWLNQKGEALKSLGCQTDFRTYLVDCGHKCVTSNYEGGHNCTSFGARADRESYQRLNEIKSALGEPDLVERSFLHTHYYWEHKK